MDGFSFNSTAMTLPNGKPSIRLFPTMCESWSTLPYSALQSFPGLVVQRLFFCDAPIMTKPNSPCRLVQERIPPNEKVIWGNRDPLF